MTDVTVTVVPPAPLVVTIGDVSSVSLLYTGKLAYTLTAGATFVLGEVGYIHTDGTVLKAQSDNTVTDSAAMVICIESAGVLSAATGLFSPNGFVSGLSGGTAGSLAYLSGTAGAITTTQPAVGFPKPIGRWLTSTLLYFAPLQEVSRPVTTDNAVSRWDGTGGVPQDSTVIITDAGATSGITSLAMGGALSGVTTIANSGIHTNTNATASTSTTTGAQVITGGLGVGGAIFATDNVTIANQWKMKEWTATPAYAMIQNDNLAAANGNYALIQSDDGSLTAINTMTGGVLSLRINNSQKAFLDANGFQLASGVPLTVADTTTSTSVATGSLINAGGFGNAGTMFLGGTLTQLITSATGSGGGGIFVNRCNDGAAMASGDRLSSYQFSGATDGSATFYTGAVMSVFTTEAWSGTAGGTEIRFEVTPNTTHVRTVALTIKNDGQAAVAATTDASSTTTGSITTLGGIGIAKALWVGGLVNIAGQTTAAGYTSSATSGTSFAAILGNSNGNINSLMLRNLNAGSSGTIQLVVGNDAAATQFYMGCTSSTSTFGAGASSGYIGAAGNFALMSQNVLRVTIGSGVVTFEDQVNMVFSTGTGNKVGSAANQKIGKWGATPVVQPAGYGTPTGNVQTINFPGATATLLQTSQQLAQLMLDLKASGNIGA